MVKYFLIQYNPRKVFPDYFLATSESSGAMQKPGAGTGEKISTAAFSHAYIGPTILGLRPSPGPRTGRLLFLKQYNKI